MNTIDDSIIKKASEGDIGSFEQIYRQFSGFVYTISQKITNNAADAQEITQDVFIKIHRNLKKFNIGTSLKSWVYRITVNTAINIFRKKKREENLREDFDPVIRITGNAPLIDKKIDEEDNKDRISSLLKILNPDQRACILLRELEGLSYADIAAVLNININTIRTRLKRAREALIAHARKEVVKNEV